MLTPLLLERQQSALDRADARRRHIAVFDLQLRGVLADRFQHGAQVFEVEQQQPAVVGDLEHDGQHAGLRLVQGQQAGEQLRAHLRHGRAHRMALRPEQIPERHRTGRRNEVDAELLGTLAHLGIVAAGLGETRAVPLHVGEKHRHADAAELFGEDAQRRGLARTGGTGNQAVAIGHARHELDRLRTFGDR